MTKTNMKNKAKAKTTKVRQPSAYDLHLKLFDRILRKTVAGMGGWRKSMEAKPQFVTALAKQCCAAQLPEEETLAIAEGRLDKRLTDDEAASMRDIFYNAYFVGTNRHLTMQEEKVIELTEQMRDFLWKRHQFRYNEMNGYAEYARATTHPFPQWKPVDERVMNSLVMELRSEGINVWNVDVARFLGSDAIPRYNALSDFMDQVDRTKWDGRDRIGELADTVPCRDHEQWRGWLQRWLMGLYMQCRPNLDDRPFGNAVVPLLVGPQGWGKSRFCRRLLPSVLQCAYTDSLLLGNKRDVLVAMSQMVLINLDEFNQYSPHVQSGFLKNVVQLTTVKVKPPYGTRQVEMPRLASFIATSNQADILADPSGSRRFIVIELTAPIDNSYELDHVQLFAQVAHQIHDLGHEWWFTQQETDAIIAHNLPYQLQQPVDQLFGLMFRPAQNTDEGQWLSAAQIYEQLRADRATAPLLRNVNLIAFGRRLSANNALPRRRDGQRGNLYCVEKVEK